MKAIYAFKVVITALLVIVFTMSMISCKEAPAAKALDGRAVEPLIEALKDEDSSVRVQAVHALEVIGDARAVEPLIEALKDKDSNVRDRAAWALREIGDVKALEPLIKALGDEDLEVIAGVYDIFIRIGKPSTEVVLIKVLNNYGTKSMAEDFLNCGNIQLEEAVRKWAKENGYQITTRPGGTILRWGSGQ